MRISVHCCTIYYNQNRKQTRCFMTDAWIKKMWHVHTMGYYLFTRKVKESLLIATIWLELEGGQAN